MTPHPHPPHAQRVLRIDGRSIDDIPSFYDEINRVFMRDEDWKLGPSLDALDDLLYGGYGSVPSDESVEIIWVDHAHTRDALGLDATRAHYTAKLAAPETFRADAVQRMLDDVNSGTGKTYFEIVQEIFESHPRFTIRWA